MESAVGKGKGKDSPGMDKERRSHSESAKSKGKGKESHGKDKGSRSHSESAKRKGKGKAEGLSISTHHWRIIETAMGNGRFDSFLYPPAGPCCST